MKFITFITSTVALLSTSLASDDRRHFYSTDPNGEGMGAQGYNLKGIVAYAYSSQIANTVPIYRCSSSASGDTLWLWTDDIGCEGAPTYSVDTVSFYLIPGQPNGVVELSRYHQDNGDEWLAGADAASTHADFPYYAYDGPIGYFYPGQGPQNTPLYAFSKGQDV